MKKKSNAKSAKSIIKFEERNKKVNQKLSAKQFELK